MLCKKSSACTRVVHAHSVHAASQLFVRILLAQNETQSLILPHANDERFTPGEENLLEQNKSFLLRPSEKKKVCSLRRGQVPSATITSVFCMYSNLLFFALQYNIFFECTERRVSALHNEICFFSQSAVSIMGIDRLSNLNLLKFGLLHYIIDNMRRFGGLPSNEAGIYERAHIPFKSHYSQTFKRKLTAQRDTIDAIDRSSPTLH